MIACLLHLLLLLQSGNKLLSNHRKEKGKGLEKLQRRRVTANNLIYFELIINFSHFINLKFRFRPYDHTSKCVFWWLWRIFTPATSATFNSNPAATSSISQAQYIQGMQANWWCSRTQEALPAIHHSVEILWNHWWNDFE